MWFMVGAGVIGRPFLSKTANYGVSMTTITIVESLWHHNDNCCYTTMFTLEFKCHLRYYSSKEVDVSLSHSAVLHYISEFLTLGLSHHIWPPAQDHAANSKTLGSQKSVVLSTFHDAVTCASSRAPWPSCTTCQLPAIAKQTPFGCPVHWFFYNFPPSTHCHNHRVCS